MVTADTFKPPYDDKFTLVGPDMTSRCEITVEVILSQPEDYFQICICFLFINKRVSAHGG